MNGADLEGADRGGPEMKVVHVVCTDAFAGVERYVTTLSVQLRRKGCNVHVIGGDPEVVPTVLGKSAVSWEPARSMAGTFASLLRRDADIIHCHMTPAEAAGSLAGAVKRVPVVSTRHFAKLRGSKIAGRVLAPVISRRLRAQISVSDYVARHVEGDSVVIPNGVDALPASALSDPVVLMVQRLEKEKDSATGIRAWHASGLEGQGWRLEIAGDGAEEPMLKSLARDLGVAKSCTFLGFRDDVPDLMSRARVLLATSPVDAFGLNVVEAMAAGLPVVAAASGGYLETVGSLPSARMFPARDFEVAASQLTSLAKDPEGARAYGASLRRLQQERFSTDAMAESTLEVYRSVLYER